MVHLDAGIVPLQRIRYHRHALPGGECRCLAGVLAHQHDDLVEQPQGALDDIDVAVGDGIE